MGATIGSMVTLFGIMVTIMSMSADRFDGGLGAGAAIGDKFAQNTIEIARNSDRDEALRKDVQTLLDGMQKLIVRLDGDARTK